MAERARQGGALLELRCCGVDVEAEQRLRLPAALLLEEARGVLEAAVSAKPSRSPSSLSESDSAPSYFLCPILKEVMRDPQISGDGFTYEAEASGSGFAAARVKEGTLTIARPTRFWGQRRISPRRRGGAGR